MKRSKFSGAQIAFILRQAEEGTAYTAVRAVLDHTIPVRAHWFVNVNNTHVAGL